MTQALDLGSFLEAERGRVESALREAITVIRAREEIGPQIREAIAHGLLSGGKRLRPILCVASYRACSGTSEHIYNVAVTLELIHAYSVMHDDLPCMDDAPLRRGEPTTHTQHGEVPTTSGGALLIPLAAQQMLRSARALGCPDSVSQQLVRELCGAAGGAGMVGGQALDLLGEDRVLGSPDLDDLHRRKTGALLTGSLRIGAIAAGAPTTNVQAMTTYGQAIGLAFQIADDVLDATSTVADLGKNPSDSIMGKSTYVTLHGLAKARERARVESERAQAALRGAGIVAPELHALATYVVQRTY